MASVSGSAVAPSAATVAANALYEESGIVTLATIRLILEKGKEDRAMSYPSRSVTVAAILLALFSLTNFPFVWWFLFPEMQQAPPFILYSGVVVGIVGLVVAGGLWLHQVWSLYSTIIVCALTLFLGVPGEVMGPTTALEATFLATQGVAILIVVLVALPAFRGALRSYMSFGNTQRRRPRFRK